jgi:16S rRNA processing protein RimM
VDKFIEFGKISGAHGLKGEMNLECFFKNFEHFTASGIFLKNGKEIKITKTGVKKDIIIIKIEGIESKTEADKMLKTELFIKRSALEDLNSEETDKHFVADLIGLNAIIENEKNAFGTVVDVVDFGGGALLEVRTEKNLEYFPKNPEVVLEVNLEKNYLILNKNFVNL